MDLEDKRQVSYNDVHKEAKRLNIADFIETSAKTAECVDEAVLLLVLQLLNLIPTQRYYLKLVIINCNTLSS